MIRRCPLVEFDIRMSSFSFKVNHKRHTRDVVIQCLGISVEKREVHGEKDASGNYHWDERCREDSCCS